MGYESDVSQSVSKIDQGTAYTSDAPSLRWPWPWPASTHLLPNDIFLYKLADHVKVSVCKIKGQGQGCYTLSENL